MVRARAHAELAEAQCLNLLEPLAPKFAAEAAVTRAIYYWKSQDTPEAARALGQLYDELAVDPWAIEVMVERAFGLTKEVAGTGSEAARQLGEKLSQPFAGYRFEPQRNVLRLMVAEHDSPEALLAALADVEPYPPWTGPLLKMRAEAYWAAKHELAEQAARDWEFYQQHAP